MLSHLTTSESSRFLTRIVMGMALVTSLAAADAFAADLMAPAAYTPGQTMSVEGAALPETGSLQMGVSLSGAEGALSEQELGLDGAEEKEILRDAHRASAYLGLALSKHMEFVLGLHGTYEHVKPEDREGYFVESAEESRSLYNQTGHVAGTRQTSFAGASLLLKIGLVQTPSFRLAVAPFLESGAGEQATYALTRSVAPKAGWMALGSYGQEGVAVINVNAGYRYRNPETIGQLALRNELFYKASAEGFLTPYISTFATADARKIMVRQNQETTADDKAAYTARETAGWSVGMGVKVADAKWKAYYGGQFAQAKGFGFGDKTFGVAVSYDMGRIDGRRPSPRLAEEVQRKQEAKDAADDVAAASKDSEDEVTLADPKKETGKGDVKKDKKPKKPLKEEFPEMIGSDINPLDLFKEEKDDFTQTEQKMADYNKTMPAVTPDQKIESELQVLKEQEAKREELERLEEEKIQAKKRAEAREQAKIDDANMREWMQEANDELGDLEGISDEELNWNGLE